MAERLPHRFHGVAPHLLRGARGIQHDRARQASLEEIRQGGSLEERFLEKVGADEAATRKLSWLDEEAG